jgi:hypothetical protein
MKFDESICLFEVLLSDHPEDGREILRIAHQPLPNLLHREEGAGLNLTGSESEGTLGRADVELNELMTGLGSGLDLPELGQPAVDPDLLAEFPMSRLLIVLPGVDMASRAGAPEIGMVLLPR